MFPNTAAYHFVVIDDPDALARAAGDRAAATAALEKLVALAPNQAAFFS